MHILRNRGEGGGLSPNDHSITWGGEGLSSSMITVLHRGVLENDYIVPRILGYYIRNIISIDHCSY